MDEKNIKQKNPNAIPQQNQPEEVNVTNTQRNGFLSFRTMVSRTLIQIIYIVGALGLCAYGIIMIANGIIIIGKSTDGSGSIEQVITGLGIILLGNLIWRIICEGWILLFNIHDVLVSIECKI